MCGQSREYKDLSDRELLNLLVSEDTTSYLLQRHPTLEDIILNSYPQELKEVKGIGSKTCARLLAVAEIAYRLFHKKPSKRQKITKPAEVFEIARDMQNLLQEETRAIYLDVKNTIIKIETISVGTTTSSLLSPKQIYSNAIRLNAEAVILIHNHPSGDTTPSKDDLKITKHLEETGDLLKIQLLDHVIIGDGRYQSIKEFNSRKGDTNN